MKPVEDALRKVARTDATVLLLGESGVGKEIAARAVHAGASARPDRSWRSTAPRWRRRSSRASSSATRRAPSPAPPRAAADASSWRRAHVLEEVAELRPELQAKLLRVLHERHFERVGGTQSIAANVRSIAATNRDLRAQMQAGRFRDDLYHRLAVFPVRLPPLRERRADILPLAEELLIRIGRELGRRSPRLGAAARKRLLAAPWRGNVRELANALERAAILAEAEEIRPEHLVLEPADTPPAPTGPDGVRSLAALEREAIEQALAAVGGNRKEAAERLGIGPARSTTTSSAIVSTERRRQAAPSPRYSSRQSSKASNDHSGFRWSRSPRRCASTSRPTAATSNRPLRRRRSGVRTSRRNPESGPRNQSPNGTPKPFLPRRRISGGRRSASARLSRRFRLPNPPSFSADGMRPMNSTKVWSRNGARSSSPVAMLARSLFTRFCPAR